MEERLVDGEGEEEEELVVAGDEVEKEEEDEEEEELCVAGLKTWEEFENASREAFLVSVAVVVMLVAVPVASEAAVVVVVVVMASMLIGTFPWRDSVTPFGAASKPEGTSPPASADGIDGASAASNGTETGAFVVVVVVVFVVVVGVKFALSKSSTSLESVTDFESKFPPP